MSAVRRVVVVGNGMVGSRFVDELQRRDGDGRFSLTALGAEPYPPYNRVLLSDVVAGRTDVASLTLPEARAGRTVVRSGVAAVSVDRERRIVLDGDGTAHPYDVLVLATGARARVPAMPGLDGERLPAGAHVLRSLDDAREIVAATMNSRRAVVVGGGVLGLEAACGLARRGLQVVVVNAGPHLMERQLDADAATALAGSLAATGVDQRVGAVSLAVRVHHGRVSAVVVDGEELPAELVVLACGTVPETGLAAACGLPTDRGIVVGTGLSSPADPAVFAIGDCAQPPEGSAGLIAQGWDQARRLAVALVADRRVAAPAPTDGEVVKLKAHGVDAVAMGSAGPARDPRDRALRLSDPQLGRHVEVVVRDGVLVGAVCVGDGALAADLVSTYTRGTPVPRDPAHLLLRPLAGSGVSEATSPTLMPDRATVCRCNGVSKRDVVACWRAGASTCGEVAQATRATTGCGSCTSTVQGLLDWLAAADAGSHDGSQPAEGRREGKVAAAKQRSTESETSGS